MMAGRLYTNRLPQLLRTASHLLSPPLRAPSAAHSGHLGDYVIWLLLATTLLALALATG